MANKPFRPPSAYKHGGYSKTVLLPWEDADEFDALHRSLRDEWDPTGALEEDAVYTILTCIWRKRRIRDKRNVDTLAALQQNELDVLSEMSQHDIKLCKIVDQKPCMWDQPRDPPVSDLNSW